MTKKTENNNNTWTIYIDGSCIGNPGPGGYGIHAVHDGQILEWQGSDPDTTSSRMELMAAIIAVERFDQPSDLRVITDSQYVQLGMTVWIIRWKTNGWRTSKRKAVENRDLWERLEAAAERHTVEWIWVRGHDGDQGNERAHELAEAAARGEFDQARGG